MIDSHRFESASNEHNKSEIIYIADDNEQNSSCPETTGRIGFYDLTKWWYSSFSEEERKYIDYEYEQDPLAEDYGLTDGPGDDPDLTKVMFLRAMGARFGTDPKDISMAKRFLQRSFRDARAEEDIIAAFDVCHTLIDVYERALSTDAKLLPVLHSLCKRQIGLSEEFREAWSKADHKSLPRHVGYERLTTHNMESEDYVKALKISIRARKEGWPGPWKQVKSKCMQELLESGMITKCPKCDRKILLKEENQTGELKCGKCGTVFEN